SLLWFVLWAYELSMEKGFLSPKLKGSRRVVKEKEAGFDGCSGSKSGNATYMKSDQSKGDASNMKSEQTIEVVSQFFVRSRPLVKGSKRHRVDTELLNVENSLLIVSREPLSYRESTATESTAPVIRGKRGVVMSIVCRRSFRAVKIV
ncbi:hypothetical protein Tco_0959865, partial [Tanacetum coccineum]